MDDRLYPSTFPKRAECLENEEAIKFYKWWKKKTKILYSNEIFRFLIEKRNISVHRSVAKPDLQATTITAVIDLPVSFKVGNEDNEVPSIGKTENEKKSTKTRPSPTIEKKELNWFFNEYPRKRILDICRDLYDYMNNFVKEAKICFP
jgi:hypothetical protein